MQESVRSFERGMTDEVQAIGQSVESIEAGIQQLSTPSSDAAPAPDRPDEGPAAALHEVPLHAAKE
jgi:hypothetical protein